MLWLVSGGNSTVWHRQLVQLLTNGVICRVKYKHLCFFLVINYDHYVFLRFCYWHLMDCWNSCFNIPEGDNLTEVCIGLKYRVIRNLCIETDTWGLVSFCPRLFIFSWYQYEMRLFFCICLYLFSMKIVVFTDKRK